MGRQTNWINMFLVLIHRLFSCFWTILLDASLLNVDLQLKLFLAVKIYAHFTSADPMQQCVSNLTCTTDLENTLKFYCYNLQYFSWDAAGIKKFLCCFSLLWFLFFNINWFYTNTQHSWCSLWFGEVGEWLRLLLVSLGIFCSRIADDQPGRC